MATAEAITDQNIFTVGPVAFEAWNDRLIMLEDPFVSGYECEKCDATGVVPCDSCGGTGTSAVVKDAKCTKCHGEKRLVCDECKGKGEFIVIPEVAQRRPTTGVVMSIGRDVKEIEVHQSVMYHDFVGAAFDLEAADSKGVLRKVVVRIIREADVLCRIHGHLELRRLKKKTVGESL
jgi:hypothetical protein